MLLRRGAEPREKDEDLGRNALAWAANSGQYAVATLLLKEYTSSGTPLELLNAQDDFGKTALACAAERNHHETVAVLLGVGCDTEVRTKPSLQTPLSLAAARGHRTTVQLLLDAGASADTRDVFSLSPLSWAGSNRSVEVGRLLLEKNVDIDGTDSESRQPALFRAVQKAHREMADLLVEKGANVDWKDRNGRTALSIGAEKSYVTLVDTLLAKGAEIHLLDGQDRTPLSWAAGKGRVSMMHVLLKKGTHQDVLDKNNRTSLSWAAAEGHEMSVDVLLPFTSSSLFYDQDHTDSSFLGRSASKGDKGIVTQIIRRGIELQASAVGAENYPRWAEKCLLEASSNGHAELVEILLGSGVNIDPQSFPKMNTQLCLAAKSGHTHVVALLL